MQKMFKNFVEVSAAKENERIKREEEHAKEQLEELRQQINQSLQDYEKAVSSSFLVCQIKLKLNLIVFSSTVGRVEFHTRRNGQTRFRFE